RARRRRPQLLETHCCSATRASPLALELELAMQPRDSSSDLVLTERDDTVQRMRADVERVLVDLTRQAVRQRGPTLDLDEVPGGERFGHGRRVLALRAVDPHVACPVTHVARASAEQAAAPHVHDERSNARKVLEDLQRDGALPGEQLLAEARVDELP